MGGEKTRYEGKKIHITMEEKKEIYGKQMVSKKSYKTKKHHSMNEK